MAPYSPGWEPFPIDKQYFCIVPDSCRHYFITQCGGRMQKNALYPMNRYIAFLLFVSDLIAPLPDPYGGTTLVENNLCEELLDLISEL